jgi:hypothetical protein
VIKPWRLEHDDAGVRSQRSHRPVVNRPGVDQRDADSLHARAHRLASQHFGVREAAAADQPMHHLIAQHTGGPGHHQTRPFWQSRPPVKQGRLQSTRGGMRL